MEIFELVWKCPPNERIVGVLQWRDRVVLVTDHAYYSVSDDGRSVAPFHKTGDGK
jgi:hypothetical protein